MLLVLAILCPAGLARGIGASAIMAITLLILDSAMLAGHIGCRVGSRTNVLLVLAILRPAGLTRGIGASAIMAVALLILHPAMLAGYVSRRIGILADMRFVRLTP